VLQNLGTFQAKERDLIVESLPEDVIELGKKLPVDIRKQFVSLMTVWNADSKNLYNPKSRFIDYVVPGVIGLILQLLTVTLMACTIARERESGTLYQLLVTSLQRGEIVIGKILPYLVVSICLVVVIMVLSGWHFGVAFYQLHALALICLLFLLCSLGLGLQSRRFRAPKHRPSNSRFSFYCRSLFFQARLPRLNNCPKRFATFPNFFR